MNRRLHSAALYARLGHWLCALPILLLVAALGSRQVDIYPPTVDEFFSMNDAGWLADEAWSPARIIESLLKDGPQHTPGYFLLLSAWGNLTQPAIALGRILTLYCALLTLAFMYRLGKDFVAPIGGLIALLVFASNTFANFYTAHSRMYPLLMLCACIVLWLTLRLALRDSQPRLRDVAALFLATFALVNTHAFSATFLLSLAVYHALFVKKDRRWLRISLAMSAAVILFLPWALLLLEGYDQFTRPRADLLRNGLEAIATWLKLATNDAPLLLLLSIIGLAIGARSGQHKPKPHLLLILPFLLCLALVAANTEAITRGGMRYQLAGMPLFALFIAAGLTALYRVRRWLALLTLLWLAAGLAFQRSANWWDYLPGRSLAFSQPPTHVLSRLARSAEITPALLGFPLDSFYSQFALREGGYINYAQAQHYFDRHGIVIEATDDAAAFDFHARQHALSAPAIWHFYRAPHLSENQAGFALDLFDELGYAPCTQIQIGKDTVVDQFRWRILGCQSPHPVKTLRGESLQYEFFGAAIDMDSATLRFVDRWHAGDNADLKGMNMSWQLISADWQNMAQLDLPLVNEGDLRHFSIDITAAPTGNYRLMVIVYASATGEKRTWRGSDGGDSTMAQLAALAVTR